VLNNKAAMFGLDARIALAIFGALSVISGAELYSAIQSAKVTQILTIFSEITKSLEAYALDTGELVGLSEHSTLMDLGELTESSKTGWAGPYIDYKAIDSSTYCTSCVLQIPSFNTFVGMRYFKHDATCGYWGGCIDICTDGADCTVWLSLEGPSVDFIKQVDERVDGTLDHTEGRIRYHSASAATSNLWINTGIPVDQF
tara:strand:- start:1377 stop:1976 length:600 start_codon:yes stop_codon:yes gene_type:complete